MTKSEENNGCTHSKETYPEKVFYGVRATITKEQLVNQMKTQLPKMSKFLAGEKKIGWDKLGAPSAMYWTFTPDKIDLCIGFALSKEVADTLKEEKECTKHVIPAGNYLKTVLTGAYDNLPVAWGAAMNYIKKEGVERDQSWLGFESYVNDPTTVKPEEIRTEIFMKLTYKRKRVEEPITHGGFCHMDVFYQDKERAQHFYGGLFGWTFMDWKDGYFMFTAPSGVAGGFQKMKAPETPSCVPYIQVDAINIELYHKIEKHGGKIVADQFIIPGHGGYVIIKDSEGNQFGLWSGKVTPIEGYRTK